MTTRHTRRPQPAVSFTPLLPTPPVEARLRALLDREPTLQPSGFGRWDKDARLPAESWAPLLAERRQQLLAHIAQVDATCQWIETHLAPRKTINPRRSSDRLKHCAEQDIGDRTNGVFIAAMLLCGYQDRVSGPNATFNGSHRAITAMPARPLAAGRVCA